MFNGKLHNKWPFSIAMLNYQRVDTLLIQKNVRRQPGRLVDAAQSAGAPTNGLVVDTASRQRMPLGSWKNRWKSQVISELSSWCSVMWNYWSYWRVCAVYIIYIYVHIDVIYWRVYCWRVYTVNYWIVYYWRVYYWRVYIYMNMIGDLNKHGGVLIKRWGIQTTNDSCLMVELQ